MDEPKYKAWWELHRRIAKGETLSEEETRIYESGQAELETQEWDNFSTTSAALRPLQERLRVLSTQYQHLAQQEAILRQQAMALERQYQMLTGRPLGIEV